MDEMPEQWTRQAADKAAAAQQGLFRAQLEESAKPVRDDKLDPARGMINALVFMFVCYLFAGIMVVVMVLL